MLRRNKISKQDEIRKRIELEANYLIDNRCTIRDVASYSGWSKSTVHVDLTERLANLASYEGTHYSILYNNCRRILDFNLTMRKRKLKMF